MGSWLVTRKLRANSAKLRAAREELAIADEQSFAIAEGEPELDKMDHHRHVMRERIARLEAEQDSLLDRLGSG
jgi:hypothetical protein